MNKVFVHEQLVRFSHCDPAAIVYFPRLFDMAHAAMEEWFLRGLERPLAGLIRERRIGTPTVTVEGEFLKPLRMGDRLRFELRVTKLGNASLRLAFSGRKEDEEHFRIFQTIAFMSLETGAAIPVPDDLRPRIEAYLAG